MNNLVYLSFGRGSHVDELVYSVLCALHMIGPDRSSYRIIMYTDHPSALAQLPVHIEPLSEKALTDWAGPFDFNHRRKIFVIKDALEKFGDRLLYCDSDTFFTKHPKKAFARVRPQHTVMHIGEYHLYDSCAQKLLDFVQGHELQDPAGRRWNMTPATAMFNAGVIGIHGSDISLLDEVLHLTDQIYPHVKIPVIEQFAFSVCFQQRTKLHQSYEIIHHYWPPVLRALFGGQLSRVLHDGSIQSDEEKFRLLLPHQPSLEVRPFQWGRQGFSQRFGPSLRSWLSQAAEQAGVKTHLKRVVKWAGLLN